MNGRRVCPNCGVDNGSVARLGYSWRDWALKKCAHCRFVYLENPPDYEALAKVYPWEENSNARRQRMGSEYPFTAAISKALGVLRRGLIKKPDKLVRWSKRWFPPGVVADVGCGDGGTLARLSDEFELIGIDISKELVGRTRERLADRQATILNMPALEGLRCLSDRTLSGIILMSFLEHEIRPKELLHEAARTLKGKGAVIIKVPNYGGLNRRVMGSRWCGFHFPGHVNYFTPSNLCEMVRSVGLHVVGFGWMDHFFMNDNMWMVGRRDM